MLTGDHTAIKIINEQKLKKLQNQSQSLWLTPTPKTQLTTYSMCEFQAQGEMEYQGIEKGILTSVANSLYSGSSPAGDLTRKQGSPE